MTKSGEREKSEGKKYTITFSFETFMAIALVVLVVLVGMNEYLIISINSRLSGQVIRVGGTPQQASGGQQTSGGIVQQIYEEVVPKEGTPTDYGVSFSTEGLETLVGYLNSVELTPEEQQRYIKIGTTPNTACEYCCGIGNRGFAREDGNIACGCAHNLAFGGLTKHLIKEGYSDQQIYEEIQRWKAYFFPQGYVSEVLEERGVSPESVGLPSQRGGC